MTIEMYCSPSPSADPLRVSCDFCRLKKLRCSGERPTCARCSSSKRQCTYSTQRRLGRPRRNLISRKSQPASHKQSTGPDRQSFPTAVVRESSSPSVSPPVPLHTSTLDQPSLFDPTPNQSGRDLDIQQPQQGLENINDPLPAVHSSSPSSQECACLSVLYLALDQVRVTKEYQFPRDLQLLSETIATGRTILSCEICPRRFVTAMLNAQGLGMLVISVAEGYSKMLKSLKSSHGHDDSSSHTSRLLYVGVPNEADPMQSMLSLGAEVSTMEWRSLMRLILRTEVLSSHQWTIISLIDELEKRQRSWHLHPPSDDFPAIYHHACDASAPACLILASDARRIIENLEF